MSSTYPGAIDNFTNPTPSDYEDVVSHSGQHSNANDAIENIENTLGTTAGTALFTSFLATDKPVGVSSPATGDMIYRGTAGWSTVAAGTANAGMYLTTDGTTPSWTAAGAAFWTDFTGAYASGSTINTIGTYSNILRKGSIIKWTDSAGTAYKHGMVDSVSGTVVTVLGTVASGDMEFQYCIQDAQEQVFIIPGNLGTGTDVSKKIWAVDQFYPLAADFRVSGTGNGTAVVDVNFNGTSMFTTKPTITAGGSIDPSNIADGLTTALPKNGYMSVDIDTASGTIAMSDGYVSMFTMPVSWRYR